MMNLRTRMKILLLGAMSISLMPTMTHALTCMVVGEPSARVQTQVLGEPSGRVQAKVEVRSPAFLSEDCSSLRLVSGKAMVSWIARDGKPNFSTITAEGIERLPNQGAEERSASVVWGEMTSKREAQRPAFMRALDLERPARVYIPADGLAFPLTTCDALTVKLIEGASETLISERKAGHSDPGRVARSGLAPGSQFVVEIKGVTSAERWLLRLVSADESARIDAQLAEIAAAGMDDRQRKILEAMLYEQLRLPVNLAMVIQDIGNDAISQPSK